MANPEHLAMLKQGVKKWNKWREKLPLGSWPDLSAADLSGAQLNGANLYGANLSRANLTGTHLRETRIGEADLGEANLSTADLSRADLTLSDLPRANLSRAILWQTRLSRANLSHSNLSAADLTEADLRVADLSAANLREANLTLTDLIAAHVDEADFALARSHATHFADLDLSAAKGLGTIQHEGPSTIGINTIYKSRGKIPEVFLRGCGVPDNFIAYMHSLPGQGFESYSCFISYSTKDQEFAEQLHADLQAKGVRCWFAPHDIRAGMKIHEQIDEAIRVYQKLLLILSEHSMVSNWVKTEIAKARAREAREGKRLLLPIAIAPFDSVKSWALFDADLGDDSASKIREYFIPDFSNWKHHDSYQVAFDRLLKDLKVKPRS